MIRSLTTVGSYISIAASALAIVTGQFLVGTVIALIGVWGLYSEYKPSKSPGIDPDKPIPSVDALKKFRGEHPDLSFTEAISALQKTGK